MAWSLLRIYGWTVKKDKGGPEIYGRTSTNCNNGSVVKYYVRPYYGQRSLANMLALGRKGVDYFTTFESMRRYCREAYGWVGPLQDNYAVELSSSSLGIRGAAGEDPAKARSTKKTLTPGAAPPTSAPSAGRHHCSAVAKASPASSSNVSEAIRPYMEWKDVEAALFAHGWSYASGTGLISDYYISPRFKDKERGEMLVEGKRNVDYFNDIDKLKEYCREQFGWKGDEWDRQPADLGERKAWNPSYSDVAFASYTNESKKESWRAREGHEVLAHKLLERKEGASSIEPMMAATLPAPLPHSRDPHWADRYLV